MTSIKNERFIPIKNYIIAALLVVVIIFLTWYGFAWYEVAKENKLSTSYLVKEKIISKEISDLGEAIEVFSEPPSSYYLLISYNGDEDVYNMEKNLESLIKEYSLNDFIYYLNVTNIKDEKNCIAQINTSLSLEDIKVEKIPTIVYFNDGKAIDVITRLDDNIMNNGDFQKLLDKNNITKKGQ